ncbi:ChaN family lipoprotein [Paracoccaceae bacterium Fryx2]|nr:ChaN family lipoprotein [Paracoccaceae bacterium Fryx2]
MKRVHPVALVARAAIVALIWSGFARASEVQPDALDALGARGADVIVLGEVHDNAVHHQHQAVAVRALQPAAIVFEMLTEAQAARVTPALLADPVALGRALEWDSSGWPDFAMYAPIFTAAPQARIYGAAVPRDEARSAIGAGPVAAFGPEAGRFGLADALAPADQAAREAEQAEAHCNALPADLLPGFVAVQRLRDAVLARAALQALQDTGGPVAVITGNGHARRDRGMPAALALAAPQVTVLSVGLLEEAPALAAPFDLWIVTAPAAREDPCAAFEPEKS